ncbi:YecA family protein [Corallococcus sicarius]|uniref:YecA family protein n=1 Tax=Corallococcus sicarius TaxID=2316726 RepID=UPI001ABFDB62|nr:SEC-C domain-containing protein [Corallococcus sicarius]
MSPSKPGRNDPCPCGSGKKYKACHAAEDRAKAAPPPAAPAHPLKQDLEGAMALLGDADVSRLSAALEHLGVLIAGTGPLPGLRYDEKAFSEHVGQALAKLAAQEGLDAREARNSLRVGVVRELGTRGFQEKLGAGLLAQATRSGRTPEERRALCVGALLATAAKKTGRVRPEDNPVLDVVFDVQFREWSQKHAEVVRKYEALIAGMEPEALTPEAAEALRQAEAGELDALVKHVQADPALVERISREAKERAQRVEAKLRDPATPSVFSPEEELWLTCVLWEPLRAMKSPPADAQGRREVIAGLLRAVKGAVDPDFLEGMLERLRAGAKDAAADEPTREWLTDAAIAFEAEPARLVLAALLTSRQEARGRSAEELVALADLKALPAWTPEQLEPYRQLLEKEGRTGGAERIRRAQDWLREHPVKLDSEEAPG